MAPRILFCQIKVHPVTVPSMYPFIFTLPLWHLVLLAPYFCWFLHPLLPSLPASIILFLPAKGLKFPLFIISLFFSSRVTFKGCPWRLGRTKTTSVCRTLLHPQDKKKHIELLRSQRVKSGREHSLGDMQGPNSEGSSSDQGLKSLVNPPPHPSKSHVLQHHFTAQCPGWCQPGK